MTAQADPPAPRVVLVGPPGAGKSTIGRKLARELGVELYDTDAGIEEETGRTIGEIFADDGEPGFRTIEEQVVRRALLSERGVVSLGGGAVLSPHTRALLRDRTVVYLEISVAEGLRRTGASTTRPLLNGTDPGAKYRELMRIRRPLYREVATVRVRTDGRSPGRVVCAILGRLSLEPVGAAQQVAPSGQPGSPNQGNSRTRARRRARARAAARRAAAAKAEAAKQAGAGAAQQQATPAGDKPTAETSDTAAGGPSDARNGGRSRRARARRARARARQQRERIEPERTESEQRT